MVPRMQKPADATSQVALAQISAVSWGPSRCDIFVTHRSRLFYKFWSAPTGWQPAPVGLIAGGAPPHAIAGPPAALTWGPDSLDVFYVGVEDAHVHHRYWSDGIWHPYEGLPGLGADLGGSVQGTVSATTAAGPGQHSLVAHGLDNAYFYKWRDGDAWYPHGADGAWESLGGGFADSPASVRVGEQLHVFGVGSETATVWHKYWDGSAWIPSRLGWEDLGGGPFAGPITASLWGEDDCFDVWALGTDGALHHRCWQTDGWSAWESLGGTRLTGTPKVTSKRPGTYDVVIARAAETDGDGMTHEYKSYEGGRWLPGDGEWYSSGDMKFAGGPGIVSWSGDHTAYFGVTPAGRLVFRVWFGGWYPTDGSWKEIGDLESVAAEDERERLSVQGLH